MVTAIDFDHRLDASVSSFRKNPKAQISLVKVLCNLSFVLKFLIRDIPEQGLRIVYKVEAQEELILDKSPAVSESVGAH